MRHFHCINFSAPNKAYTGTRSSRQLCAWTLFFAAVLVPQSLKMQRAMRLICHRTQLVTGVRSPVLLSPSSTTVAQAVSLTIMRAWTFCRSFSIGEVLEVPVAHARQMCPVCCGDTGSCLCTSLCDLIATDHTLIKLCRCLPPPLCSMQMPGFSAKRDTIKAGWHQLMQGGVNLVLYM